MQSLILRFWLRPYLISLRGRGSWSLMQPTYRGQTNVFLTCFSSPHVIHLNSIFSHFSSYWQKMMRLCCIGQWCLKSYNHLLPNPQFKKQPCTLWCKPLRDYFHMTFISFFSPSPHSFLHEWSGYTHWQKQRLEDSFQFPPTLSFSVVMSIDWSQNQQPFHSVKNRMEIRLNTKFQCERATVR